MRVMGPGVFVVALLGSGVGVTLYQKSDAAVAARANQAALADQVEAPSGLASVLSAFGKGAEPVVTFDPLTFMPAAPTGWERRDFAIADAEAVTLAPFEDPSVAPGFAVALGQTNDVMAEFLRASARSGIEAVQTYQKDGSSVLIKITPTQSASPFNLQVAQQIKAGVSGFELEPGSDAMPAPMLAAGLYYRAWRQVNTDLATRDDTPVTYRVYTADLGGQATIRILTDANDADLLTVASAIDLPGMVALIGGPAVAEMVAAQDTPEAIPADLALVAEVMPEPPLQAGPEVAPAPDPEAALPTVRRLGQTEALGAASGSCVIENGVRRCRVGN